MHTFAEALQSNVHHIKWTSCSNLPYKLYSSSVAVSADGDAVYVAAGSAPDYDTKNDIYCYNTNTDHWTVLPQPGHRFGILHMLDDRLTIFGGEDPFTKRELNKVTTYNNDTNRWYSCYPDMLYKRFKPGVISYYNYMIVMGGHSSPDIIQDTIEVMDYQNELQWREIFIKLPLPIWAIKPTISGENVVIVGYNHAGGCDSLHFQIRVEEMISSLEQPVSTGAVFTQWKMLSPATHWNTITVPYSNPPVIIGGSTVKGDIPTSDVMLYDTSKNLWRNIDSLTSARSNAGVGLLNNSTIIIIGGMSGGIGIEGAKASSLTTVEIGNIVVNN